MQKVEHIVLENEKSERIDKVISKLNGDWSRTQVQQWIKEGNVFVNGISVKTNYKCNINDQLEIMIPEIEVLDVISEEMDLDI
jgi:23S rRNA pseudouridine1911/1915/1917 synthase